MKAPVFVTGNQHKADLLAQHLGMTLERRDIDLEEIQGTSKQIAEYKARRAYEQLGKPVLVEDVSLSYSALGGLPGPYVKAYLQVPDGLEILCRMVDGFTDRSAIGRCVYAYFDGQTVTFITGEIHGEIADHPRGTKGFGWGAIFIPNGSDGKTRAELGAMDDPASGFPSLRPWAELRKFLEEE